MIPWTRNGVNYWVGKTSLLCCEVGHEVYAGLGGSVDLDLEGLVRRTFTWPQKNKTIYAIHYSMLHNNHIMACQREPIAKLRELYIELNSLVLHSYGFDRLRLKHDFYNTERGVRFTVSKANQNDILLQLLQLNHLQYDREVKDASHNRISKKKSTSQNKSKKKPKENASDLFEGSGE